MGKKNHLSWRSYASTSLLYLSFFFLFVPFTFFSLVLSFLFSFVSLLFTFWCLGQCKRNKRPWPTKALASTSLSFTLPFLSFFFVLSPFFSLILSFLFLLFLFYISLYPFFFVFSIQPMKESFLRSVVKKWPTSFESTRTRPGPIRVPSLSSKTLTQRRGFEG